MTELTQSELKEMLHYNPYTGIFIWKIQNSNRVSIGAVAGCLSPNGYIVIGIDNSLHRAHRLAFLYMTGEFPKDEVDHINGISDDNMWSNLRECSRSQNMANTTHHKNNTSGYKGVYLYKSSSKWYSQIAYGGKRICLGYFTCKHEAAKAYNKKALELHGAFARLNEIEEK